MTLAIRRQLVIGILIVVGIWPLAHHALVRATGMSPWKGFGWAMYCVPPRNVRAFVTEAGSMQPLQASRLDASAQLALQAAYKRFSDLRAELGHLVKPTVFAAEVLRRYPDLQAIDLYVEHRVLSRSSARIERERLERFRYRRDQSGGAALIEVEQLGLDGRLQKQ